MKFIVLVDSHKLNLWQAQTLTNLMSLDEVICSGIYIRNNKKINKPLFSIKNLFFRLFFRLFNPNENQIPIKEFLPNVTCSFVSPLKKGKYKEEFPEEWQILIGIIFSLHESCNNFDYSLQLTYLPGVRFNS